MSKSKDKNPKKRLSKNSILAIGILITIITLCFLAVKIVEWSDRGESFHIKIEESENTTDKPEEQIVEVNNKDITPEIRYINNTKTIIKKVPGETIVEKVYFTGNTKEIPTNVLYYPKISDFEEVYTYSDLDEPISRYDNDDEYFITRTYAVRHNFSSGYSGSVIITNFNYSLDDWSGVRFAIVNPENHMERYEIRLYPKINKFQANYVDRTNRIGDWSVDEGATISDYLISTNCEITNSNWYNLNIFNIIDEDDHTDSWKATLIGGSNDCEIIFDLKEFENKYYQIGVQSAGRDVEAKFNNVGVI